MLRIPPSKHSGLIVVALWENDSSHPELKDFERETRAVVERAGNLSLQDVKGKALPCFIHESQQPRRRFAVWVARLEEEESANTLAKRIQKIWIGRDQPATHRRFDVDDADDALLGPQLRGVEPRLEHGGPVLLKVGGQVLQSDLPRHDAVEPPAIAAAGRVARATDHGIPVGSQDVTGIILGHGGVGWRVWE